MADDGKKEKGKQKPQQTQKPQNPKAQENAKPQQSSKPQDNAKQQNTKPQENAKQQQPKQQQQQPQQQPAKPQNQKPAARTPGGPKRTAVGFGIVRAVLSGDSLLLVGGAAPNALPPTKEIGISGIIAPKFARSKKQADEIFSWHSREFLRARLLGKQVGFRINNVVDEGREYATVTLDGENIAHAILRNGWARINEKSPQSVREELDELEKEAKAAGRGIWQKQDTKLFQRTVDWNQPERHYLLNLIGKPLKGVVDKVLSGSVVRIELTHPADGLRHKMIALNLAGAHSPRVPLPLEVLLQQYESRKGVNPDEQPPEQEPSPPFAEEALRFTEARLLNVDVDFVIQGVDKTGAAFGTILHPKGNITLKLLEAGLAKIGWSATWSGEEKKLTEAEKVGRAKGANLWSAADNASATNTFRAKVVYVHSGDSVTIKHDSGEEQRVGLASLRAPRMANPRRNEAEEPLAFEAREFVRRELISKTVRVISEYTPRQTAENPNPREQVTIYIADLDIGEAVVRQGFAEVIRHGAEAPRSSNYARLLNAEHEAERAGRGIHDKTGKKAGSRVLDLTDRGLLAKEGEHQETKDTGKDKAGKDKAANDKGAAKDKQSAGKTAPAAPAARASRARLYLRPFQQDRQLQAVVEYAFSGHRFKLYIPKEQVMIFFSLAGVRSEVIKPGAPNPDALAAQEFVKSRVLQQTVTVEIDDMDKGENFIGTLFFNRQNLGLQLLQEGLAWTTRVDKNPYGTALLEAERTAKESRKGVWAKENFENEQKEETEGQGSENQVIVISEIVDAATFYYRAADDKEFTKISAAMESFEGEEEFEPAKNSVGAGQFSDGKWYRVRVESKVAQQGFKVFFMDYGNHETFADKSFFRALPEELQKIPSRAHLGVLAGIKAPASTEFAEAAAAAFHDLAWERELNAKLEFYDKERHKSHFTLFNEDSTINKILLQNGHCRVLERAPAPLRGLVEELKADEKVAKDQHLNIWVHGDVSDGEEESESRRREEGRPPKRK